MMWYCRKRKLYLKRAIWPSLYVGQQVSKGWPHLYVGQEVSEGWPHMWVRRSMRADLIWTRLNMGQEVSKGWPHLYVGQEVSEGWPHLYVGQEVSEGWPHHMWVRDSECCSVIMAVAGFLVTRPTYNGGHPSYTLSTPFVIGGKWGGYRLTSRHEDGTSCRHGLTHTPHNNLWLVGLLHCPVVLLCSGLGLQEPLLGELKGAILLPRDAKISTLTVI